MKTKFLIIVALFGSYNLLAQEPQISDTYHKLGDLTSPVSLYQYHIDSLKSTFKNKDILFNNKMLNIMFSERIGTNFGGSSDLSLQKYYASLDADDDSFSFGVNMDTRGNKVTNKLNWLLSAGFKLKSKNSFSTLIKNGDFQENNIGLTFKVTKIGKGSINFNNKVKDGKTLINRKDAILEYREVLYKKYDGKVKLYDSLNIKKVQSAIDLLAKNSEETSTITSHLNNKSNEYYEAIARDEIKYMEEHDLYNFVSDGWLSIDGYIPLGEISYNITEDINNTVEKIGFRPFEGNFSYTYFREYSCGMSYYIMPKFNVRNNNNIIADQMSTKAFQDIETGLDGVQVITDSNDVYITEYDEFITTTLKAEVAVFFFNNTVGFSPAIEKSFGEYDAVNWKLGIPISLKDKEGKPKINFEIQWKEQGTLSKVNHYVGISANFIFGKFLN